MHPQGIALTSAQHQGLTRLLADVASFMAPLPEPAFKGYERLVHKPKFWVGRLALTDYFSVRSVILKHVPPEYYPPEPDQIMPDLREEQLVYQFLATLRSEFDRVPDLWGQKPGLLVLEDLALIRVEMVGEERMTHLADTFAQLHAVCGREQNLYHRLRQQAGLKDYTGIGYPSAELWFGFLEGMQELKAWCDLFALSTPDWATLIQAVRVTLKAENPFLTLIHTELASPRNAMATQRGVCLLDFEQASLGHALLDIAAVMIGRIEWKTSEQGYFLNHLYNDMTFADLYRQKWQTWSGSEVTDEQWQKELATTLIFTAGLAIGSARRAGTKYVAVQPLVDTLGEILHRLTGFLLL
jgi:hypothetical protein